jgi:hypothetical protein
MDFTTKYPRKYSNLRMFWRDAKTDRRDAGSTNSGDRRMKSLGHPAQGLGHAAFGQPAFVEQEDPLHGGNRGGAVGD